MIILHDKQEQSKIEINILQLNSKNSSYHGIDIFILADMVSIFNNRASNISVNETTVTPNKEHREFLKSMPGYVEINY
jgi:hypothetical protein